MGILATLKAKLTGGTTEEQPEEITTNLTPALEKSLIYWHSKGKVNEKFIKGLKNVNSFDADKIIEHVKKLKE